MDWRRETGSANRFDIEGVPCGWRTVTEPRHWSDGRTTRQAVALWAPKGPEYPRDDLPHLERSLSALPREWRGPCKFTYDRKLASFGRREANLWLLDLWQRAERAPVRLTASDEAIRFKAESLARLCQHLSLPGARAVADRYGAKHPKAKTDEGELARYRDARWWRRQLRQLQLNATETVGRGIGLVSRHRQLYVTDAGLRLVNDRRQRNRAVLEALDAVNECGEAINMADLSDRSVANPKLRRNELMARISGTEAFARAEGYRAFFVTITCPSRFHAVLSASGKENPRFDGSTPQDGARYLNRVWANIRRWMQGAQISYYGVRVREPQQDGTPHDHYLLFVEPSNEARTVEIMRSWALRDSPSEPGAQKHRFTVERIDYSRGTATGYVAKYISKNVDGHGLENDLYGKDAASSAQRVQAWASVWRMRQFSFFGTPAVGVWRELRRTRGEAEEPVRRAAEAADQGKWESFMRALQLEPLRVFRVWSDAPGSYGEPKGDQVLGVETLDTRLQVITREHVWSVVQRGRRLQDGAPWSSVNKCTLQGSHLVTRTESRPSLIDWVCCTTPDAR
jgi:hypothetical protein